MCQGFKNLQSQTFIPRQTSLWPIKYLLCTGTKPLMAISSPSCYNQFKINSLFDDTMMYHSVHSAHVQKEPLILIIRLQDSYSLKRTLLSTNLRLCTLGSPLIKINHIISSNSSENTKLNRIPSTQLEPEIKSLCR